MPLMQSMLFAWLVINRTSRELCSVLCLGSSPESAERLEEIRSDRGDCIVIVIVAAPTGVLQMLSPICSR